MPGIVVGVDPAGTYIALAQQSPVINVTEPFSMTHVIHFDKCCFRRLHFQHVIVDAVEGTGVVNDIPLCSFQRIDIHCGTDGIVEAENKGVGITLSPGFSHQFSFRIQCMCSCSAQC